MSAPHAARPRGPTLKRRAGVLLRLPVGVFLVSWQYFWRITALHRSESRGDVRDLPPPLPPELVDEHSKLLAHGVGPMFHRRFRVWIEGSSMSPEELVDAVADNPNRVAPSTVAVFHKTRGDHWAVRVGDEYRVQMPGPWDGPVRVVARDATSLRLGTLQGHLEAGQIEFRACYVDGLLEFGTEAWSRAGDRWADVLYSRLRVAKEIQFNMWVHFCLRAAAIAGGRVAGGVVIDTRGIAEDLCHDAAGR
ncbi:MAG TPA: DUF1990 family protein [Streptomyces sp.]|jgi:hypothetical protein|nr:DUF1990 family protein [Streptomyces sp.]